MQQITIRTHQPGQQYHVPHFFILNKGKNSGKPAKDPWINCYVALAPDAESAKHYYWLSYALWSTSSYYPYRKGSVIEFITIADLRKALRCHDHLFAQLPDSLAKLVEMLQLIQASEQHMKEKLAKLKKIKRQLLHMYAKPPA